jgi:hypothetical protein
MEQGQLRTGCGGKIIGKLKSYIFWTEKL